MGARLHHDVRAGRHQRRDGRRWCRSTSTSPTRTSSSPTSTTCCSAGRCSRSSPGIYHWFPKMTGRMYNETPRQVALLDDVRLLQPHVRPDAPGRPRGHAAPRRRLRRPVRDLERDHVVRVVRAGPLDADLPLQHDHSWRSGAIAPAPTRGTLTRSSGRSVSPPPIFNFDEVPTVVGHPYEYGVPGARHGIFKTPRTGRSRRSRGSPRAGGSGRFQARQQPTRPQAATARPARSIQASNSKQLNRKGTDDDGSKRSPRSPGRPWPRPHAGRQCVGDGQSRALRNGPVHLFRGDALCVVLHGVLLHPGRPRRRLDARRSRSSTRRRSRQQRQFCSRPASLCTGRSMASSATTVPR